MASFVQTMRNALRYAASGGGPRRTGSRVAYRTELTEIIEASRSFISSNKETFSVPSIQFLNQYKPRPSSRPLEKLRVLPLDGLELGRLHEGQMLLCRNILRPIKNTALMTVIEDTGNSRQSLLLLSNLLSC